MYTYEIQYVLDPGIWIKNLQAKICAKDQLPRQNPSHVKAYIVNTERSNKAGEHWLAVIFNNNGNVLYFDSYGLAPLETEIINFLNNHSSSWRYNRQRLQSLQSKGHKTFFSFFPPPALSPSFFSYLSPFFFYFFPQTFEAPPLSLPSNQKVGSPALTSSFLSASPPLFSLSWLIQKVYEKTY